MIRGLVSATYAPTTARSRADRVAERVAVPVAVRGGRVTPAAGTDSRAAAAGGRVADVSSIGTGLLVGTRCSLPFPSGLSDPGTGLRVDAAGWPTVRPGHGTAPGRPRARAAGRGPVTFVRDDAARGARCPPGGPSGRSVPG